MIQINKAVLHLFDYSHGQLVLSEMEMDADAISELHFTGKQIDKLLASPSLKKGEFAAYSKFQEWLKQYADEEVSLLDLSKYLAKTWYEIIKESDKIDTSAMLLCDVYDNANHLLVALKYKNKSGYQHTTNITEGKLLNKVMENASILPGASASVDEVIVMHLETMEIRFKDIKRIIQGDTCYVIPERILHASQELSCKEVLQTLTHLGSEMSETYELDPILIEAKTKEYMQQQLEDDGYLHTEDLARFVFDHEEMAKEYLDEAKKLQVPDLMRLHNKFTNSKSKSQKIKTDHGIELNLPAAYYHDPEYFEIIQNEDETFQIVLKNIKQIR